MSTSRVRLLVASGRRWDAAALQLALVAEEALARGLPVVVAAPEIAAPAWRAALPGVAVRALTHSTSVRAHRAEVRALAESIRANVALVDDELMRNVCLRALGDRGCVLQRLGLGEEAPAESFVRRLAARRTPAGLLIPQLSDGPLDRDTSRRTPAFPVPFAIGVHDVPTNGLTTPEGEQLAAPGDAAPGDAAPVLLVIPDPGNPMSALPAIRAAAHVVRRQTAQQDASEAAHSPFSRRTLRIHLLGAPAVTQGLRVQAAALRIANAVTTEPLPADGFHLPAGCVAAWVTASGDEGAHAVLTAMSHRVPVLLDANSALAPIVTHAVTGVLLHSDDPLADAIAAGWIARLMAHDDERRSMGAAGRARAQRLHGVARLTDAVFAASERLAGMARRAA